MRYLLLLTVLTTALFPVKAFAKDKSFDPLGVRLGSFLLHPGINVAQTHESNIYKTPHNEQGDFITTIKPSLELQSDWDLHHVKLSAQGGLGRYREHSDENYQDAKLGAYGRYDLDYETWLDGEIRYEKTHEDRDSPDDPNGDKPTEYNVTTAKLGFTRALGKLHLFLNGRLKDIDYQDAKSSGVVIDNDIRDRLHKEADLKLAYVFTPAAKIFLKGIADTREYDNSNRSSDGRAFEAGTQFDMTGKLKGALHGGWIKRDYGAGLKDVNIPDFGASVLWNINPQASLKLGIDRNVIETTAAGVSGYIRDEWFIDADYMLKENISLNAALARKDDDFIGGTREDESIAAALGLTYKPRRGLDVFARYGFTDRESNMNSAVFKNHAFTLGVGYKF